MDWRFHVAGKGFNGISNEYRFYLTVFIGISEVVVRGGGRIVSYSKYSLPTTPVNFYYILLGLRPDRVTYI